MVKNWNFTTDESSGQEWVNGKFRLLLTSSGQEWAISHLLHLVHSSDQDILQFHMVTSYFIKNGNLTLLLTSKNGNFTLLLTSQEWQFHIATNI